MKYTWGDTVTVKTYDENGGLKSEVYAVVVGLTPVDNEQLAKHLSARIGDAFYTVEYSNGSSENIAEERLSPLDLSSNESEQSQ